ncbi:UDP-N-acetylmuramoyl-tripeptide--D-alanyl-D-alanine ligase [Sphingobacteriaceae bacterium AH-315-L07]|nr:UDP-N-acetylmuramoyl-tripeptide--D-alanyl-D-alanine ligase [Sphingobacteriaceae bacterium AH-315-L07]
MILEDIYKIYQQYPQVSTDTRKIEAGTIFFALKGPNFNGNEFAERALEIGAEYVVIDQPEYKKESEKYIMVDDVLTTLQNLASYHRKQFNIPVLGITGTNGKTTTKELIKVVLDKKYNVLATEGNFNNHIGVPLTLLKLNSKHQIAVIEMGANHQGEIDLLCKITEPNFGLITNIGKAHLEGFGSYQGVIDAKKELYDNINSSADGIVFINNEDEVLRSISAGMSAKITYGKRDGVDLRGELTENDPCLKIKYESSYSVGENIIETQIIGSYNMDNILAAVCIGSYFEVNDEDIIDAVSNYIPGNNRSQIIKQGSNTIILDAYNANPVSMELAIAELGNSNVENKIVILGDMFELGDYSSEEHLKVVDVLNRYEFQKSILVGEEFGSVLTGFSGEHFNDTESAMEGLRSSKIENSTILIKGSRGMKLEDLLEAIK